MYQQECDVFISGSGVSGLYAAIVLSKIGLAVHITESNNNNYKTDELILFSPRSLQLLQRLDLLNIITQKGIRHWKFEIYQNKGYGNQAVTTEKQSMRLWENETTEYNYSISIEKSVVYDILKNYLEKEEGVEIDTKKELIQIEEKRKTPLAEEKPSLLSSAELALYYQHRPLPITPNMLNNDENSVKSIHLKHLETGNISMWKSKVVIGADGQTSNVRQKLGISLKDHKQQKRTFYTLQINIISTNYPGVRQISTLSKKKDILYIIGHQTKLYVTFEHKSSWSKLSIDDEIPANVSIKHIKSIMEPYQIEFGQVKSYTRWDGNNTSSCEEYNLDSSYFFIGSAAQSMTPPGLFDINTNLDKVQNLCWKLALSLQHSASPKLLETFEQETKQKIQEVMHVSSLFTNLIGDYYKHLEERHSLNASHSRDLIYYLRRFKSYFVGSTSMTPNILNSEKDDISSISDRNSSTPSFVFMGPSPSSLLFRDYASSLGSINLAIAGCLAPNAKLKPYTLFQLLVLSSARPTTATKPILTTILSSGQQEVSHSNGKSFFFKKSSSPPPSVNSTPANNKENGIRRSNSVTSSTQLSNIWSMFQKNQSSIRKPRASSTIVTHSTPASVLISPERWKSIKTNHLQLLDQINKSGCTFTILIFCGSIHETQENTRDFIKLLGSPISFLHRYERATSSSSSSSSSSSDHRHSMYNPTTTTDHDNTTSRKSSFEYQRRDSTESFDQTRFSTTSTFSSFINHYQKQSSSLFSIVFVSNSSKSDAVKYLNNTPPATVHLIFPSGLTRVFLDHDGQCYKAYNVRQSEVVVIRPDGYIGTRVPIVQQQEEESFNCLSTYFDSFLRPPVDMNTAAAVVAAGYC